MKIIEIIAEDSFDNSLSYEQVKAIVEKSCAPFLKKVGGFENAVFKKPLFRGVNFFMPDALKYVEVNQNRKPVDMPEPIHDIVNNWFLERTGIPFRSASVFATGDWLEARGYAREGGGVVTVLPVGTFNYCWSSVYEDLYEDLGHYVWNIDKERGGNKEKTTEYLIQNPEIISSFLKKGKYKVNTGLINAITAKKEIMINCENVIIINQDWINDHDEALKRINKRGSGIVSLDRDIKELY